VSLSQDGSAKNPITPFPQLFLSRIIQLFDWIVIG